MPKGEYYDLRLGSPSPVCDLRSEWYGWFLEEVDTHDVEQNTIALWALGGAGFILKTNRSTIYVDPYCSGSAKYGDLILHRMIPIPFNASDVKKIHAAVFTHEDIDHLDESFVFPVSRNADCLFIGPPAVAELLESWKVTGNRIVSLNEDESRIVNDVTVTALPSYDPFAKMANTYIFETAGIRILHSGDSFFFDGFLEIGRKRTVDIALVALGTNVPGAKWYNNPGEVVQIARDLNAKILIPMHWDLWSVGLEDPHLVEQEVATRKLRINVVVLKIGQRFDYP